LGRPFFANKFRAVRRSVIDSSNTPHSPQFAGIAPLESIQRMTRVHAGLPQTVAWPARCTASWSASAPPEICKSQCPTLQPSDGAGHHFEDRPARHTARTQISIGGKVTREATGTLTKRGRPPVGEEPKQQVTLRLAPKVVRYFKQAGDGWQTRLNETLEEYVAGSSRAVSRSMPRAVAGVYAMAKNEQTGKKAGTAASKVMRSGSTGKSSKTAAGSALTQRRDKKKKK
jgi:uncharacterized protein (DUF4415 family)